MTKKEEKMQEKYEAIKTLQRILPPGSRVYCILRSVSRSGMSRTIDFYACKKDGPVYLTGYIARALDYRQDRESALKVGGCGMDMGFHIVNSLSYAIHGMKDRGDASFHNARRGHYRAGYSLKHDWL
jgi:hypothetical protein